MSLELTIQSQDGTEAVVPASKVVSDLKGVGVEANLSSDGSTLYYELEGQPMQMPVSDFVAATVGPVTKIGFSPETTDFSTVDPELRLGIEHMPSDNLRRKYLEVQMEARGFENPQIVGQGSDWAMFNPETGSYSALTNESGFDMSDLAELGALGPQILGSVVGGALGAGAGGGLTPAAIATGALGATAGGQIGRGLVDAYLASTDEGYRNVMSSLSEEDLSDILSDRAMQAGMDVAGGALGGLVPAAFAATRLGRATGLDRGLVTRGGEALGSLLQGGGAVTSTVAKGLNNPFGRAVLPEVALGTGPLQIGGWLAQAPSYLTRNIPKAGQWAAKKLNLPDLAEEFSAFTKPRVQGTGMGGRIRDFQSQFGAPFRTAERVGPQSSVDILQELGARAGRKIDTSRASKNVVDDVASANAEALGVDPSKLRKTRMNKTSRELFGVGDNAAEEVLGQLGRRTGQTFEAMASAGRGLEQGIEGAAGLGIRGVGLMGRGVQGLGGAIKYPSQLAQPFEYRGIAEGLGTLAEEQMQRPRADMNRFLGR